ncbi:FAD-dependent oxidoreductase [Candidatus Bathyarchaeota archaeon]|nr:FAD-dependent oxidoreductase [Candidatus Bathyarchaeota archaeon]
MTEQNKKFDVLIIGTGPAGLTAAIYSSWLGLKTLALDSGIIGGTTWLAPKIDNYPGYDEGIKGSDLIERMRKHASRFGAEIRASEEVVGFEVAGKDKLVTSRKDTYVASAVIFAIGTQRRKLLVPGEAEFLGRGVSYCAVCDALFFRGAKVAVVGDGKEAAMDALLLADIAGSVLLVSRAGVPTVDADLLNKLKGKPNVELVKGKVTAIQGQQVVKAIKILQSANQEIEKEVKGVIIALGGVPLTEIVKAAGINVDINGCLIVDRQQRTNVEGVFAAGDCTCGGMQVVTAAGEGAMAAMKASAHLRNGKT